jgi:hypothetical protein
MRPHFAALFFTWLTGSLTAGLISTSQGNVENLVGDGTLLGILDATAGWLVYTFPYCAFIVGFLFLPLAVLMESGGAKALPFYIGAGVVAVAVNALIFAPSAFLTAFGLLVLPAVVGGTTWWALAIRPSGRTDPGYA